MKVKTVLLLREAGDLSALPNLIAARPWAAQAGRIAVQVGMAAPVEAGGDPVPPLYDAVVEIWSDAPVADAIAADPLFIAIKTDVRTSQEVVGKPGAGPGSGAAPMGVTPGLSQLSFIRALDDLPRSEIERHWQEHIPLAKAIHVGMNRYVQDRLSPGGVDASPWFGMAHLHFPDETALRDGLFRSADDIAVITADVAEFVADHATMLAVEHIVKG